MVSDEKFGLLHDINTSKNKGFELWIYNAFNLHEISDDDCMEEFRFQENDILRLIIALQLPGEIQCDMHNDLRVSSVKVLCVILKRLAFSCRYSDMMAIFARPVFNWVSYKTKPSTGLTLDENLNWLN